MCCGRKISPLCPLADEDAQAVAWADVVSSLFEYTVCRQPRLLTLELKSTSVSNG